MEAMVGTAVQAMKLGAAAKLVEESIEETLTYYAFPSQHWLKIRTNNPMERLLKEARRRTKVVGAFPDARARSKGRTRSITASAEASGSTERLWNSIGSVW